ncbi:hypothetical protein GCM10023067_24270 [Aminobacter aganoensis]
MKDSVPSSGTHRPSKQAIRDWGETVERDLRRELVASLFQMASKGLGHFFARRSGRVGSDAIGNDGPAINAALTLGGVGITLQFMKRSMPQVKPSASSGRARRRAAFRPARLSPWPLQRRKAPL